MTKYTKFEAIFRNETLVFTDRDPKFRNRLDVYNYICARAARQEVTESSSASTNPRFATKKEV